jgi:hypothetical protein
MSRNVTVQFSDGTNHVYEDVPDEVHDDEVKARANSQFGKDVSDTQVEQNYQPQQNTQPQDPSTMEKVAGAAMIPAQMVAEHPLAAAGALGAYKALNLGNKYLEANKINAQAANDVAKMRAATEADAQALARERMAERMARPGMSMPGTPKPGQSGARAFQQMGQQLTTPVNPAEVPITAPATTPTVSSQPSVIQRATEFARQGMARAHAVGDIAMQKVLQNAGNIGRAGVGIGALTYSQGLNPNEQQQLQQRQMMPPTIR